jgi:glycine cleavage system transcriptional repressor
MKNLIISAFGPDQTGIVSRLTGIISHHGGNVEDSRMTRLGSDFAILLLVSVPNDWVESLSVALQSIQGLTIQTKLSQPLESKAQSATHTMHLSGADHEGIVYKVTDFLAEQNINIEEMDTSTSHAPISGTVLFTLNAQITCPSMNKELLSTLVSLGNSLGVEITIIPKTER